MAHKGYTKTEKHVRTERETGKLTESVNRGK